MRALVATGPSRAGLCEVPDPLAGAGEVIVRVERALTCGTDLKMLRRGHPLIPFPAVLGHEFAGTVETVGDGASFAPGERVTSTTSGPCGSCVDCRRGAANLCPHAFAPAMWGAFADRVKIPRNVVKVGLRRLPNGLSAEAAALLDPLAAVVRGVSRVPERENATWLVYGAGPIAVLVVALARRRGAGKILVAGRQARRLEVFEPQLVTTIDTTKESVTDVVRDETRGRGADVVVEATGDPRVAAECVALAARGGTVLLFAGSARDATVPLPHARVHYDEISIVGSFHYTPAEADEALRLLSEGAIPIGAVVTGTLPLERWEEAFARVSDGRDMKVALVP